MKSNEEWQQTRDQDLDLKASYHDGIYEVIEYIALIKKQPGLSWPQQTILNKVLRKFGYTIEEV